ncbi:MATE efflux family protein [Firmicutes bacterium M10-2]|nr:MATE efflux family protein [Firmicutes bacterium M10-2]
MKIKLSDHFTYRNLLRFTLPSVVMVVFTSLYTIVDGIFVSNVAGSRAFAALNLIWPVIAIMGTIGFMIGTGGSALVAKLLGEHKEKEANACFSLLIYFLIAVSVVLSLISSTFIGQFAELLGATPEMIPDCVAYGRTLAFMLCGYFLQAAFQSFLVTAERPSLGLLLSLFAGFTNMTLDYLFICVFRMGIFGAALATGLSWIVGGFGPLIFFLSKNSTPLRLGKPEWNWRHIGQSCFNGSSEMVTNLSMSVITVLYNYELMKLIGEGGVVAYGILQYISFVFAGAFLGYSMGIAPVISYHYGAENHSELKNLLKKSLTLITLTAIVMVILAELSAGQLASIFVSGDPTLMEITIHAIRIYSVSFLLCGFNIFGSSFFTALNNGFVSAAISFLRTFVFQIASIIVLPIFFGLTGIWSAVIVAETLSCVVVALFFNKERKKYGY